ncbi:transglutaminase domain-containing protein [Bacillus sp. JJ1764]|uniref:transglutaminase domain-containing protein n=1 Tax=Bacillus sp. JJ1764 TaxID=3122964 RepID=UPI002FFFAF22
MKKLFVFFICILAFMYLSYKDQLPTTEQIRTLLNLNNSQTELPTQQQPQQTDTTQAVETAAPNEKYSPTTIQTYQVVVEGGKLIVTGTPTPYGKFHEAKGIILDIDESRANKKTSLKIPFSKGKIQYEYPLAYNVGDVIINLDEYYQDKPDDPNKVLGYAVYHLNDGDPNIQPSFMVQSDDPSLMTLAKNVTSGKQTDIDKSRAIFEWVTKHISYNAPLANSDKPPLYSALETYQSRIVLCSGYADLSAALHRAVGIEAKVVYGENHAWNEVKLNGGWHTEDPTYGAGYINANTMKFVHHYQPEYFSKTDKHKEGEYPW